LSISLCVLLTDIEGSEVYIISRLVVIWCVAIWDDDWSVSFPWRRWGRPVPFYTQWYATLSKMVAERSWFNSQSGRWNKHAEII